MKRKTVALLIAAVAVALVGLIVLYMTKRRATETIDYETVPVRRDTILATVNASGNVKPRKKVTLAFPSGGLLAAINVQVGQKVEAGQELARLDTRQLELSVAQAEATLKINEARLAQVKAGPSAADLAAAEASLESAQALYESAKEKLNLKDAQLSLAEADLKRAELALQDAQAAYDRVAWRPDIGMLPVAASLERATLDYQRALANYKLQVAAIDDTAFKSAAAQLAQAKAQLEKLRRNPTSEELAIAEAQVEQSKAALEQAKLRLADATLVAPFTGTVLSIGAEIGELVSAATPVIVLADLEHHYIDASVDEADIGLVQAGQDAVITLDAFPDARLTGRVTRIHPLGTVSQGVVSYAVEVEVASTDVAIQPNMTAIVDIVVARKEGVLVVPNRAVKRDSAARYSVEVFTGNTVEQRSVTIGLSNELVTEIVSGLREGEEVVVYAPRRNVLEQFTSPFGFGGRTQ
ncbi:MAG: efflux RND transporter periplasmic adaptor subunit [Anaerolineae bacterium]